MSPLALVQPDPLNALAARIRAEHEAVRDSARSMLDHAIAAGEALIEAKTLVEHGKWLSWLETTGLSARQAQKYMRLAKNAPRAHLPDDATINEALDALSTRRAPRSESYWSQWLRVVGEIKSPDDRTSEYRQRAHYVEAIARTNPQAARHELALLQGDLDWLTRYVDRCERQRAEAEADERAGHAARTTSPERRLAEPGRPIPRGSTAKPASGREVVREAAR